MAPSDAKPLDENTPLLAAAPLSTYEESIVSEETNGNGILNSNDVVNGSGGEEVQQEDKPLPKLQVFLLCWARLIEPIAFFGIFPFLPKMVEELGGLDEADIGFYSGSIVRSFPGLLILVCWESATSIFLFHYCITSTSFLLEWKYHLKKVLTSTGINVFIYTNATDDSMGPSFRPYRPEACPCIFTNRGSDRNCRLRTQ
jgi:hypothetical protein